MPQLTKEVIKIIESQFNEVTKGEQDYVDGYVHGAKWALSDDDLLAVQGVCNNRWIDTNDFDRLPTEKDGNGDGYVFVILKKHCQNGWRSGVGELKWYNVSKHRHSHWMKIPLLPTDK